MTEARFKETKAIYKNYADFYRISGGLALVIFGIWIGSLIFTDGYATNVYTELLSVIATILVLDQINQWRDRRALKERLMNEVRSPAHGTAITALEWLRKENWIDNNSFMTSDLQSINWSSAFIGGMDFSNSKLMRAVFQSAYSSKLKNNHWQIDGINLKMTDLSFSHFDDAELTRANLENANIFQASFQNAKLPYASFKNAIIHKTSFFMADLSSTNLQGTDFFGSRLIASNLYRASFDNTNLDTVDMSGANLVRSSFKNVKWANQFGEQAVILPDGVSWTADTDMEKFTNPAHPDFDSTLEKINAIRQKMGIDPLK